MGAGHAHAHALGGADRGRHVRILLVALALNLGYTAAEAVAGLLTGSLALLADAGHNLSDAAALAIALVAARLAARPPTARRSFGYQRAEILSALLNGVLLVVVSIWILIEAAERFSDPPDVPGGWIILVAGVGIAVNAFTGVLLWRTDRSSLNLRMAALHLLGDALASVGVVVAGIVILTTGWLEADPLVSVLVSLLIVAGTWSSLRDSIGVLLEEAPRGLDVEALGRRMASASGVVEVHDLHVWTITSGFPALSAHVLVRPGDDCHARRRELESLLEGEFGIEHTTLQVDHAGDRSVPVGLERFGAARPPGDASS